MKFSRPSAAALLWLAGIASIHAQTPAAPAASPAAAAAGSDEAIVLLPSFSVSGEPANPYNATDSMSATRVRSSILDTPVTINVLTRDFLDDIGAQSIYDAAQYIAGTGQGRLAGDAGILDRQTIRGFESNGRIIDNFLTGFQGQFPTDDIERIEIVKGPSAILSPSGSPGGSINVITKSPQFNPLTSGSVTVSNFGGAQFTADNSGPINSWIAYRVAAAVADVQTYIPGKVQHWDVNPSLLFKLSPRTNLVIKGNYLNMRWVGGASNPGTELIAGDDVSGGATLPNTPPPGFGYHQNNTVPNWATRSDTVERVEAELTQAIGERVTVRLGASYLYDKFFIDGGQQGLAISASRYDPYTGVYTPGETWALSSGTYVPTLSPSYNPLAIPETATYNPVWTHDFVVQNDWAGHFNAGPVSLEPVAGAYFDYQAIPQYSKTATLPTVNLSAINNNPVHPPLTAYNSGSPSFTSDNQGDVYADLRSGFFDDKLLITTGATRYWANDSQVTYKNPGTANGYGILKGNKDSFLGGALYEITKDASVYYSFMSNSAPNTSYTALGVPVWQSGKQQEFGFKTEWFNQRLMIEAAHYQVYETNLSTPNPAALQPGQPGTLLEDQTNHGYEFQATGYVTNDLTLLIGATKMADRDPLGRRPRNIPDRMIRGMIKYDLAKGMGVWLGVDRTGDSAGEIPSTSITALGVVEQVSFYVPERTILNAGAFYKKKRYRLNLNVSNLLDQRLIWQAAGRYSLTPFPTTQVMLTTTLSL